MYVFVLCSCRVFTKKEIISSLSPPFLTFIIRSYFLKIGFPFILAISLSSSLLSQKLLAPSSVGSSPLRQSSKRPVPSTRSEKSFEFHHGRLPPQFSAPKISSRPLASMNFKPDTRSYIFFSGYFIFNPIFYENQPIFLFG